MSALQSTPAGRGSSLRRDAYSVILFNAEASVVLENDIERSPDELLIEVLKYRAKYGTNFGEALRLSLAIMENNWDPERHVSISVKIEF